MKSVLILLFVLFISWTWVEASENSPLFLKGTVFPYMTVEAESEGVWVGSNSTNGFSVKLIKKGRNPASVDVSERVFLKKVQLLNDGIEIIQLEAP